MQVTPILSHALDRKNFQSKCLFLKYNYDISFLPQPLSNGNDEPCGFNNGLHLHLSIENEEDMKNFRYYLPTSYTNGSNEIVSLHTDDVDSRPKITQFVRSRCTHGGSMIVNAGESGKQALVLGSVINGHPSSSMIPSFFK